METRTYRPLPRDLKAKWGEGPWVDEPDKVQWQDAATGLPCLIVRNHSGALCGYVGVSEGHPLFGKSYEAADAHAEAHGGFTFAGFCQEGASEDMGVCHVPAPGEPDRVYWLGFDCSHSFDVSPTLIRVMAKSREDTQRMMGGRDFEADLPSHWREEYRTIDYVRQVCTEVAASFAAMQSAA